MKRLIPVYVYGKDGGDRIPAVLKMSSSPVARSAHILVGRIPPNADTPWTLDGNRVPLPLLRVENGDPVVVRADGGGLVRLYPTYDVGIGLFGEGITRAELHADEGALTHLGGPDVLVGMTERRGDWV